MSTVTEIQSKPTYWTTRLFAVVDLFNEEKYIQCVAECKAMLSYFNLPRYHRIHCYTLIADATYDPDEAEEHRVAAETLWINCRYLWPKGENEATDKLMQEMRVILDHLAEDMEANRPLVRDSDEEVDEEEVDDDTESSAVAAEPSAVQAATGGTSSPASSSPVATDVALSSVPAAGSKVSVADAVAPSDTTAGTGYAQPAVETAESSAVAANPLGATEASDASTIAINIPEVKINGGHETPAPINDGYNSPSCAVRPSVGAEAQKFPHLQKQPSTRSTSRTRKQKNEELISAKKRRLEKENFGSISWRDFLGINPGDQKEKGEEDERDDDQQNEQNPWTKVSGTIGRAMARLTAVPKERKDEHGVA